MRTLHLHVSESSADDGSDARLHLTDDAGGTIASASLWWSSTPSLDGASIGTIGSFSATDAESTKSLLDHAADILRQHGCHRAVGPMDGNTWGKHRFVIRSNGRGPFLLEPRNPAGHPGWWEQAGFSILSRYSSSVMPLDGSEVISSAVRSRLLRSGIHVRKIDVSRYEDELRLIHSVSLKSFSNNFLYTPLEESAFLHSYLKVRDHVDSDLVIIAERGGIPCGFVFGISDLEAASRGEKPALVVKTLAVDPESRCAGLGSLLVDELHRTGREKGYTEAIHALQHESNSSLKITGRHHGEAMRGYALFSRLL
ncbi:MAG: N-acetyltransferase [Verrucomicrobiaceae bacterium]|nr:MAG: N-acetyltransferase [Verrucomicrobiaceae bacterium]